MELCDDKVHLSRPDRAALGAADKAVATGALWAIWSEALTDVNTRIACLEAADEPPQVTADLTIGVVVDPTAHERSTLKYRQRRLDAMAHTVAAISWETLP